MQVYILDMFYIPVEPERKDRLIDQTLGHHVLEHGDHALDGNAGIRHAQNAVETASHEDDSGLLNGFGEGLVNHLGTCDAQNVGRQETCHGASAILDAEFGSVGRVGARQRRIVLIVISF